MCFSLQIDKNLKHLAQIYKAEIIASEFVKLKNLLASHPHLPFKIPGDDGRVYPHYFAPVIVSDQQKRIILPMRYRLRPQGSVEEIPAKYNVFNARLDALHTRKTWKSLIGKNHGIVPVKKFFEWVPDEKGKSRLIAFYPKNYDSMAIPCLFDHFTAAKNEYDFYSFAVITTDPPADILAMGHDRCPIFLDEENSESWMKNKNEKVLQKTVLTEYQHQFV
jgi:putative SOS response-associated peptidase YedK